MGKALPGAAARCSLLLLLFLLLHLVVVVVGGNTLLLLLAATQLVCTTKLSVSPLAAATRSTHTRAFTCREHAACVVEGQRKAGGGRVAGERREESKDSVGNAGDMRRGFFYSTCVYCAGNKMIFN